MHDDRPLFTPRTLLTAAIACLVFVLWLHLSGRPTWCKYGFDLWSPVRDHCTSQNLFDPYSLSHVLHGVIFFWLLRPWAARISLPWRMVWAMLTEMGWELLENSAWVIQHYRQATAAYDYQGDSVLNSVGDLLSTVAGFAFAARYSWKGALVLFVAFELWLLFLARDNLTLNVLMLLWPIESIKQWQLAG